MTPAVFPGRQYHFNPPLSASVDFSHGVKNRARSADVSIPPTNTAMDYQFPSRSNLAEASTMSSPMTEGSTTLLEDVEEHSITFPPGGLL